ncbi:hypothetical protein SAY86_012909 [Trapa natans]|uniref:Uncharacterized protein n=1 Tax=Trapa natans TaxID=22666 RepID=A0AAN7RB38_TRANT|nr:hypothetical protein SAY86_012909 [Trapa natans]
MLEAMRAHPLFVIPLSLPLSPCVFARFQYVLPSEEGKFKVWKIEMHKLIDDFRFPSFHTMITLHMYDMSRGKLDCYAQSHADFLIADLFSAAVFFIRMP